MMLSGGYIVSALFLNQLKQHLAVKKKTKKTQEVKRQHNLALQW